MTKTALVTGSSQGIGRAIAKRLAVAGYHVFVTFYSNEEGGLQTIHDIVNEGGSAELIHLNLTAETSVLEMTRTIRESRGHLDILVHNAVKEVSKPIDQETFEEWRTVLGAKLDGAFLVTKASLDLLRQSPDGASVVMMSTFEAQQPSPDYPAYGVANAGIDAFVKAMAQYLPRVGARCNAVCPGPVRTPLWGPDEDNESLWADLAAANPVGRNATPEDVAEVVLMIATDPTRMLNGNFIYVNGGNHLRQS